ncbi:hypothetical protein NCH01_15500 [Neoasaia chiangmaiensis]|nr:hypothetical protein NCH01_15500 [Neoasaia chiangmaiensis]
MHDAWCHITRDRGHTSGQAISNVSSSVEVVANEQIVFMNINDTAGAYGSSMTAHVSPKSLVSYDSRLAV